MNKTSWSSHDDEMYVIPQTWFDKWKNYTNFDYYMSKTAYILADKKENKEFFDKTETYIKDEIIKHFESTYLIGNSNNYPGAINNNSLLYERSLHLQDENHVDSHLNYNIKEYLIEGQDFIVVSKIIWEFFKRVYGGNEIKRHSLKINSSENIIEIKLKNVRRLYLI